MCRSQSVPPVADTEAVLNRAIGHAGEPDELVGREHLVFVEQGK